MSKFSILIGIMAVVGFVSGDDVIELDDSNFDQQLEEMDAALVMFYAPWCGHCKKLKPEYEVAAKKLKANDPPVYLAKVDCTEGGTDTCGRFGVSGYPTLKIFRNGEFSQDYSKGRQAGDIVAYMRSQAGPASKECKSESDIEKLLSSSEVVVISYLKDSADQDVFAKVTASLRESVKFGHYADSKHDKVVLYRPRTMKSKFEESELTFDGKVDKPSLEKWIKANYHGLVGHRTADNIDSFKEPLLVAYYDVDYERNVKSTNYWRNRVLKTAKDAADLSFAVSNRADFHREIEEFGLSATSDKPVVGIKSAKGKFAMTEDFSADNLAAFVKKFKAGELEAYIKSEPVPESNDGPVKVAVGKNFAEVVTNNKNDVLVEFYAPWCGHCKKLSPIYDELGDKMSAEDVDIVKMDATANDVPPGFDVRGFPTLFWLPSDTKKPVAYDGGRELDDFVKYIAEHAVNELNGFDRAGKAKKSEL